MPNISITAKAIKVVAEIENASPALQAYILQLEKTTRLLHVFAEHDAVTFLHCLSQTALGFMSSEPMQNHPQRVTYEACLRTNLLHIKEVFTVVNRSREIAELAA